MEEDKLVKQVYGEEVILPEGPGEDLKSAGMKILNNKLYIR